MNLHLLDLNSDVLLKIVDYVPLKDKLHTLWDIPEFRPLLEYRRCYLASPAPFSLEYLELFRSFRPGWYMHILDWNYRVYGLIDETTLRVTRIHFELNKREKHPFFKSDVKGLSVRQAKERLQSFYFYHLGDDVLTYHLRGYGFVTVNLRLRQLLCFYKRKYVIYPDEPIKILGNIRKSDQLDFKVVLTRDLKLVVDFDRKGQMQELCPITFGISKDHKFLTWEGGDPIPMTLREDFNLEDDGQVKLDFQHYEK